MSQRLNLLCLSVLSLLLMGSLAAAEPAWGTWLENAAEAKSIAYAYNRPIIAVIGSTACDHCNSFDSKIIGSSAVEKFATENRLVLFHKRGSINTVVKKQLMDQVPGTNGDMPFVLILKVREGADLTTDDKQALNADQVEIIQCTQTGNLAGINYPSRGGTINGVTISKEALWNGTQFNSLIASFFPNQFWGKDMVSETEPGEEPDPTDPDDPDQPVVQDNWGVWLENVAEAKRQAYENNRPLVAVISATSCPHCDYFEERIQKSTSKVVTDFARQNRLVLCYKRGNISIDVKNELMKQVPGYSEVTPFLLILKVKDGANLTDDNRSALNADQVEILHSIPFDRLAGINYPPEGAVINGVSIGGQTAWTCEEFVELIKTFFPNTQGLPLTVSPEGYEDAIDLGVAYDNETFPTADSQWTRASGVIEMPATGGTHWFKFTGRPGQRYGLFATHGDESAIPATMPAMSFALAAFASADGVPQFPEVATWTFASFDGLNRGFHLLTPDDDADSSPRTYYLRLTATPGTGAAAISYNFRLRHYAETSPAKGSEARPLWTGAEPGKWSMDYADALQKAATDGRHVLVNVTGLTWCPYCTAVEHRFVCSNAFKAATANTYLVTLDNRRRSGYGPSLLTEDFTGGYLKTYRIDAATAEAKLTANKALQETLVLPPNRVPADGWPNGKVGYPSFIYCRVEGTAAAPVLVPVGRFSTEPADGAAAATRLAELHAMANAGLREDSGYAETSTLAFGQLASGSATVTLAPLATTAWLKFTVSGGLPWRFSLAPVAGSAATLALTAYAADGTTQLAAVSGALSEGLELPVIPSTDGTYWLKVTAANLSDLVNLTVAYEQRPLTGALFMDAAELYVPRDATTVKVPVRLKLYQPLTGTLRFTYSVKAAETNGLDAGWFTAVAGSTLVWDSSQETRTLNVSLKVPASADAWSGTRDLLVTLEAIDGDGCSIQAPRQTVIRVCATPHFAPKPAELAWTLYQGLTTTIDLPVCAPSSKEPDLSGLLLPKGMSLENHLDDSANPRLTLTGKPTDVTSEQTSTIKLLADDGTVSDTLAFTLSVAALDHPALDAAAFTAALVDAASTAGDIDGLLTITRAADGLTLTLASPYSSAPQTVTVPDWSRYDATTRELKLDAAFADGTALTVAAAQDGTGTVAVTIASGEKLTGALCLATPTPTEYAGRYTVAIRPAGEYTGITLGWMTLDIAANGLATSAITLYDGTTASVPVIATPVWECSTGGGLYFYAPLYWRNTLKQSVGKVCGLLTIVPASKRDPGGNDAWISACGETAALWLDATGDQHPINPCGTLYDGSKSLTETVGVTTFTFVAENPSDGSAVVPSSVALTESLDGAQLVAAGDSLLASLVDDLTIDSTDGTFTGTLNVLVPEAGTGSLQAVEAPMAGIITPVSQDCCSVSDLVAVGYGSYTLNGKQRCIRVFPHTATPGAAPNVKASDLDTSAKTQSVMLTAQAPGVLMRRLDRDELFHQPLSDGAITVPLDATTPWEFIALPTDELTAESAAATLANRLGAETLTVGTTADGEEAGAAPRLHVGWNLVGVPATLAIPVGASFANANCFEATTVMTPADALVPGRAYWLYVKPNATVTLDATPLTAPLAPSDEPPTSGWRCRAWTDGAQGWFWNGSRFVQTLDAPSKFTGLWQLAE